MLKVFLVSALCLSYKGYKVKHCQDINFKISLSMFVLKENILYKEHIVQWYQANSEMFDS